MTVRLNEFKQPIGRSLVGWKSARHPEECVLSGRFCRLERINVERHVEELFAAFQGCHDAHNWTYLPYGPFDTCDEYRDFLVGMADLNDPFHYVVIDQSTKTAVGTVALMRIDTANGVIEVGHVVYSPRMQRTPISTEVMALLQKYVFEDLGYRRLEWKCDSLNVPSRAAAERFGFMLEGVFRQLQVTRGRNRDTAWFSLLDREYALYRPAYEAWLAPTNFDDAGLQIRKLADLITQLR